MRIAIKRSKQNLGDNKNAKKHSLIYDVRLLFHFSASWIISHHFESLLRMYTSRFLHSFPQTL